MAGEVVPLASWLGGAVSVTGVLDNNGLVSEVRRANTADVVFTGTIKIGNQRFPLAGAMPIPVPVPNRFSPDTEFEHSFSGRRL